MFIFFLNVCLGKISPQNDIFVAKLFNLKRIQKWFFLLKNLIFSPPQNLFCHEKKSIIPLQNMRVHFCLEKCAFFSLNCVFLPRTFFFLSPPTRQFSWLRFLSIMRYWNFFFTWNEMLLFLSFKKKTFFYPQKIPQIYSFSDQNITVPKINLYFNFTWINYNPLQDATNAE